MPKALAFGVFQTAHCLITNRGRRDYAADFKLTHYLMLLTVADPSGKEKDLPMKVESL